MHDRSYRPVIQPRVNIVEDVRGFYLHIDGTRIFIPREVVPAAMYTLGMQLPAEPEIFNLLAEVTASHFQKCAAVASAEDG